MNRGLSLAVTLTLVSVAVVLAGLTGAGSTAEWRALGLALLPTAVLASLLAVYFDWRRRLLREVRAEAEPRPTDGQA